MSRARSPLSTRLFYGVGSIAEGTKNTACNVFLLFYYNNVLGLPGTLGGTAIFLALCADAITDPLIGALSDETHTCWGRWHPYMALGLVVGPGLMVLYLATLVFLTRYEITRRGHEATFAELARRREGAAPAAARQEVATSR